MTASDTAALDRDTLDRLVADRFAESLRRGCECLRCPLGPSSRAPARPVLPELRTSARLYVIGEAPGEREVATGAPFVGPSGRLLMDVLRGEGLRRADVSLSNAMLCRPLGEYRTYLRGLGRRNRARAARAKAAIGEWKRAHLGAAAPEVREATVAIKQDPELRLWPAPTEACRPRVLAELRDAPAILTLGATAYATVTGVPDNESGMMAARGFPQRWREEKVTAGSK